MAAEGLGAAVAPKFDPYAVLENLWQAPAATTLPMALIGGRVEEGVLPLTRINGRLGVQAVGGGGTQVIVQFNDMRGSGQPVQMEHERGSNGETIVRAWIRDEVNRATNDGALNRATLTNFGIPRQPTAR